MLARLISCSLALALGLPHAVAQDPPRAGKDAAPAVTPEQAAAAAKALKEGLASQDAAARVKALHEAAATDHDDVAKVAGGVFGDKDESVRIAAAEVLGAMTCKE